MIARHQRFEHAPRGDGLRALGQRRKNLAPRARRIDVGLREQLGECAPCKIDLPCIERGDPHGTQGVGILGIEFVQPSCGLPLGRQVFAKIGDAQRATRHPRIAIGRRRLHVGLGRRAAITFFESGITGEHTTVAIGDFGRLGRAREGRE